MAIKTWQTQEIAHAAVEIAELRQRQREIAAALGVPSFKFRDPDCDWGGSVEGYLLVELTGQIFRAMQLVGLLPVDRARHAESWAEAEREAQRLIAEAL